MTTASAMVLLASAVAAGDPASGGPSIQFNAPRKVFLLRTHASSYAFGIGSQGLFINLHWGGRVDRIGDVPEPLQTHYFHQAGTNHRARFCRAEYPASAEGFHLEPCLKVESPAPLVNLKLAYDSHRIDGDRLQVILRAAGYPFSVVLHYRVYPEFDLIDRWVEVKNDGPEPVRIENVQSAVWYVPHTHRYRLTHLAGNWAAEWQVRREVLEQGEKVLQSRNGISGHFHVPYFALDQDGLATERSGAVWFGTLQWSGNWKMIVEQDPNNQVRVAGGWNDYDFALDLAPGESRSTPVFTAGYTRGGFGEASRLLHRYQRKHLYPKNMRGVEVPIVYNTYGSIRRERVTEANVLALVPKAAEVGVEMFIIDAGWQAAIGHWTPHPEKFPRGLKPIIDEVHRRGMKFGLWVEPERAMSDAPLYREREEWLFAKNPRDALLNLARRDVLEHVYAEMARLLRENDISYLKLDFNRYFEIPDVPDRRAMRTKYVENFYELFARLRRDFPKVFFENCAGGSGRPDLKMDTYFARMNRCDNQDTLDCIKLQEGFTYLHPAHMAGGAGHISYDITYMMNHREAPFRFMAHVGMMGWLATSLPLDTATPEELAEIKGYFDLFKRIRRITCGGEIHRLASLREHPYAAFEFVLPDASEALLFVFGHGLQFAQRVPNILMESLDPETVYDVEVHGERRSPKDIYLPKQAPKLEARSGRGLMEIGVPVDLFGDYDSRIFHFRAARKTSERGS